VTTAQTNSSTDCADFRRLFYANVSSICVNLRNLWIFFLYFSAPNLSAFIRCHFDESRSSPAGGTYSSHRHFIRGAFLLSLSFLFAGCGRNSATPKSDSQPAEAIRARRELRIAAAADLKFALIDLVTAFEERHPDATITVTPGSSGNFFAQLSNEAPFDLFLSADIEYPHKLIEQGQGVPGTEFKYGVGYLVVWAPIDSALDMKKKGFEIVRDDAVQRIAVATPKHAPNGRAAVAALKSAGLFEAVESRLVYGENIAQTAQMVESGAADIGIIALSLAVSPALRDKGKYWRIPGNAHPPIVQGGVVLRCAQDATLANAFREFLMSAEGAAILRQYGFDPAGE
jgi:molybdate transport system substrate-binding protein